MIFGMVKVNARSMRWFLVTMNQNEIFWKEVKSQKKTEVVIVLFFIIVHTDYKN